MANYIATSYKLPEQLSAMNTYIATIVDTKELKVHTVPLTTEPRKSIAIVWHKT